MNRSFSKKLKIRAGNLNAILSIIFIFNLGCQSKQEDEIDVVYEEPNTTELPTIISWLDSTHFSPQNKEETLSSKSLQEGGPSTPVLMTYAQANMPLSLFYAGLTVKADAAPISPMPYLAFVTETTASLIIRNIKSVNGENIASSLVTEQKCPDELIAKYRSLDVKISDTDSGRLVCVPLINSVVQNFLLTTDNSGFYVHEFLISAKKEGKSSGVLQAKIGVNILIPESPVSITAASDLLSVSLAQRLLIATNDLKGSPRRDFKAFEISSTIAPGVATSWLLSFTDPLMIIEEEVFFESPVIPGINAAKPSISRGNSFFKRKARIDSVDHFRVAVVDEAKPEDLLQLKSRGTTVVEIPIREATNPLKINITPDFASPQSTKSMFEYVKPFGPTFCERELAAFKPEEWRQSLQNPNYVACEATLRKSLTDLSQALAGNITYPIETYFGSFSYLPRLNTQTLGGTHGVLSMRISFTAKLKVSVRNPHNPTTTTTVAEIPISYSYQLPTVLTDMESILVKGSPPPGLDTIRTSMIRKGIFDFPVVKNGSVVIFPFMGEARTDVIH